MRYTQIEADLKFLLELVDRWQKNGAVAAIEQGVALDELQKIYKRVLELPTNAIVPMKNISEQDEPQTKQYTTSVETDTLEPLGEEAREEEPFGNEPLEAESAEEEFLEEESAEAEAEQIAETEQLLSQEEQVAEPEPKIALFGQLIPISMKARIVAELFCHDEHHYRQEVIKLESMPDLDSALIYIGEKYSWSAESVLAQEFIALLANKLES